MGQELVWIVKQLLLPPGGILLLGLSGLLLGSRRRSGRLLLSTALLALYLLSAPFFANLLMAKVERYPALTEQEIGVSQAEAIVVLGGGRREDAAEYGATTVSTMLLERLRYAAYLARRTGLPVIPSGGSPQSAGPAEALLAKRVLEHEFSVTVLALEAHSRTTWENAQMTAELLQRLGLNRILLVSHALHMPRAITAFRRAGVDATPAPTVFYHTEDEVWEAMDWLPQAAALKVSYLALHELLGDFWYRLRHRWQGLVAE